MHFGLLPRANRGISRSTSDAGPRGQIQVGLFNIMQEGDVQIQRLPRAAAAGRGAVFTANPEDYTARGKSSRR